MYALVRALCAVKLTASGHTCTRLATPVSRSTMITETIYREQLRPVIEGGAEVMDRILPARPAS